MEEDLKKDLEQMAREEGRSLNNMINHLLKCAVVNGGILRRAKVDAGVMLLGKENGKPQERTWFGNDVAYDFPNCKDYKDGRCEVYNCACKDWVACRTKYKKRWEKDNGRTD